ncbi:MAG: heme lyase CcmF/NrfE family subunit [Alphaproteobacteria bacterium]|nr:heme lyase CcmF/NrfE family subunit [Alphaproteobacteria bacterium]
MIAELGHFALILALCVACAQATVPLLGAAWGEARLMELARPAAHAQLAMVALAFAALTNAYVTGDFSVAVVAQNSHSAQPLLYRVSAVWGNHEGSLVLWVLILAVFGAAVAGFGRNLPPALAARTLAVQAMIGAAFLAFILATSNPFARAFPAPAEGMSLNPLLQDPGLAFHPPLLYGGYVGLSIVFSFAVAALLEGRIDAAWSRWVRPWTLAAWVCLTAGIALGSWWAYYELGWGGWWYWDQVENASFMPWLVATALLHSAIVVERRDALKSWTVLLAILGFSLSLLGTFLVRSGVLTSVHTFASDPGRGLFILLMLVVAIGGSLALYAWRAPKLSPGGLFAPVSREGAVVLNNLLLCTGAATVFVGTLYPLALEVVGGGRVSVGPPFFAGTFVPLMVPLAVAVAVGPLLAWKRADLGGALGRLGAAAGIAGAVAVATLWIAVGDKVWGAVGLALAAWLAAGVATELAGRLRMARASGAGLGRRLAALPAGEWGMALAHLGLAVAIVGMTASSLWERGHVGALRAGESMTVAGYTVALRGVAEVAGPNYTAARGQFDVAVGGRPLMTLLPERRHYHTAGDQTTTEAAIRTRPLGDLYVVLGEPDGQGAWTVRVHFRPMVSALWAGALMMVLGGLASLADRRLRVGAPSRRRRVAQAAAPTA